MNNWNLEHLGLHYLYMLTYQWAMLQMYISPASGGRLEEPLQTWLRARRTGAAFLRTNLSR